jgi:hypothetical protein
VFVLKNIGLQVKGLGVLRPAASEDTASFHKQLFFCDAYWE